MTRISTVILAAGKGERMRSNIPKVMHKILDKPMIGYVVDVAKELQTEKCIVVVGSKREEIKRHLKDKKVEFCVQKEQKGTAHAVLCAENLVLGTDVLVLYGDVPLIQAETLRKFLNFYKREREITFMVTKLEDPSGYGRVIMEGERIEKIVEEKDANQEELQIKLVNTGICIIPSECFFLLKKISNNNKKGEFYLTDICSIAKEEGRTVRAYFHPESKEFLGVNTKKELYIASEIMRKRIIEKHLESGVIFGGMDVTIGVDVKIGCDVKIGNNVEIKGETTIGSGVEIGSHVEIIECVIENGVKIGSFVYIEGAKIKEGERIPSFSYIAGGKRCAE